MAGARDIKAGAAYVELYTKNNKFVRGLEAARKRLAGFGRGVMNVGLKLTGLGSAVLAPLATATNQFVETGDLLHKMADRTGVSTNALSELGFAAEQSGASLQDVHTGLTAMQGMLGRASRGLSRANFGLEEVGLSYEKLKGLSPEEQFMTIAESLSEVQDASRKAYLAQILFGGASQKLLPMLNSGAEGIAAMRKEAQELGLSVDPKDAEAAAAFGDAWNRVKRSLGAVVFHVGAALAPMLTEIAEKAKVVTTTVARWIEEHRALIATIAKIAAGIVAAGAVLTAVGGTIFGLSTILGAITGTLTTFGTLVGIAGTALSALISPLGIIASLLIAGGGAWLYFSGAGEKAIAWLRERWQTFADVFLQVFGGIKDALMAGELALAGKIAMQGLQIVWQAGMNKLLDLWYWLRNGMLDLWNGLQLLVGQAFFGLIENITSGIAQLLTMLENVAAKIPGIGNRISGAIRQARRATEFGRAVIGEAGNLLEEDLSGKIGARKRAEVERRGAQEAELAAMQKELASLREEAAQAYQIAERDSGQPPVPEMPEIDVAGMQQKLSAVGGFNPAAVLGMGFASAQERTATATEQTAKHTLELTRQEGLRFA